MQKLKTKSQTTKLQMWNNMELEQYSAENAIMQISDENASVPLLPIHLIEKRIQDIEEPQKDRDTEPQEKEDLLKFDLEDFSINLRVESFFSNSNYHRRLVKYCRQLSDLVCELNNKPSLREKDVFFEKFVQYARENPAQCTTAADELLTAQIEKRQTHASAKYAIDSIIHAWKVIHVNISQDMQLKVLDLNHAKWKRGKTKDVQEHEENDAKIVSLIKEKDSVVNSASQMTPQNFRYLIDDVLRHGKSEAAVARYYKALLNTTGRGKTDIEIFSLQLLAEAYFSYSTALGIRSGHIIAAPISNFKVIENKEGLFQLYKNGKTGGKGIINLMTRVVPTKVPTNDPIIKMALYMYFVRHVLHLQVERPFLLFRKYNEENHESSIVCGRIPLIGLCNILLYKSGFKDGFSFGKKLHTFRMLCNNILIDKGASEIERELHHGWAATGSIEKRYYRVQLNAAAAARTPYMIANRSGPEDPPHPLYDKLDSVPAKFIYSDNPTMEYLSRVALCAISFGCASKVYQEFMPDILDDSDFKSFSLLLNSHVVVKVRQNERSHIKQSSKRQLEDEIAALRAENRALKKQKVEEFTEKSREEMHQELLETIGSLIVRTKLEDFPSTCYQTFIDKLYPLIEQLSDGENFGTNRSRGVGKSFTPILHIVAAYKQEIKMKRDKPTQSWLGWMNKTMKNNAQWQIKVITWNQYKKDFKF